MNNIFGLDWKPFAVFSTFVAVNAVVFGIVECLTGGAALGVTPDRRSAAIWWAWAVIWGTSFFTDLLNKELGKFVPCLQIAEAF